MALERDPSRADLIRENRRRLGLPHLDVVSGSAPEALEDLPIPTSFSWEAGSEEKMCGAPNVFWNALFYG